jgi:hypothetical protein
VTSSRTYPAITGLLLFWEKVVVTERLENASRSKDFRPKRKKLTPGMAKPGG